MVKRLIKILFMSVLIGAFLDTPPFPVWAQTSMPSLGTEPAAGEPVELNGDQIEFIVEENKFVAEGNVSIVQRDMALYSDRIEFYRDTKEAYASGNVLFESPGTLVTGDALHYNFTTKTGEFENARFYADPLYGYGEDINKVGENHFVVENGYVTTSDYDKPGYRVTSRHIDVYPGDKAVARNVNLKVGKVPILYMPRYTQDLSDRRPRFTITPGYEKDFGGFVLTSYRWDISPKLNGTLHLDYRERKDVASGVDLDYVTEYGQGLLRTYYMQERNITSDRIWEDRPTPTTERERYKTEWRHKWDVDETTNVIAQYYKLSDRGFLKTYFEQEYRNNPNPETYALATKVLDHGILSLRTDVRVNRFNSAVERLPELQYDLSNQPLGDTNFYAKSRNTYSNLVSKPAAPSDMKTEAQRFDTDNEISYPFKLAFLEMRPFVGGQWTYYSETEQKGDDVLRSVFQTGADISTKFYRVYDVHTNALGLDINRLRHIISPSVAYLYQREPTVANSRIYDFDSIDDRRQRHLFGLSLENKIQTKRDEESIDLARLIVGSDYHLKDNDGVHGFETFHADLEIKPQSWLTFFADTEYDAQDYHLQSANFDIFLQDEGKWRFGLGRRYDKDVDDQVTGQLEYIINPKWRFNIYERIEVESGIIKEQQYAIGRDLHSWDMELVFNDRHNGASEFLVVFTLKAFPDIGFDAGTSFNRRRTGSQDL